MTIERAIRIIVLLSMSGALASDVWFARLNWGQLPWVAAGAVLLFAAASRIRAIAGGATAVLLAATYLMPAIALVFAGWVRPAFQLPWQCALLGLVVGTPGALSWRLPSRWRPWLALWALTVSLAWPIVVARELDLVPELIGANRPFVADGMWAGVVIAGLCDHVATFGVSLLWFDWLFRAYPEADDGRFRRQVVAPLAAGAAVAAAVGIYQGFVDMTWLSGSVWPSLRRATGTLFDSNVFGTIAGLWGGLWVAFWSPLATRPRLALAAGALVVSWLALWSSGARTALLAGIVSSAFALVAIARQRRQLRLGRAWLAAGALLIAAAVAAVQVSGSASPVRRIAAMFPELSWSGAAQVARQLWARDMYGTAATRMIADHPWFGIGPGFFHAYVVVYSKALGRIVPPDNAQNWFRHQLAELGIVGSLGWLAWVFLFLAFFARKLRRPDPRSLAIGGALVALTLVSLVGMPTQHPAVVLTFWTMVFWFVRAGGRPPAETGADDVRRRTWRIVALVALAHAAGTAYLATHDLRVPNRARRFDAEYSYGFAPLPVAGADRVWTIRRHAVVVPPALEKWLKLTVWVEHPGADRRPVETDVWIDGERVLRHRMPRNVRATRYAQVPDDGKRFVLEARVDRTFRPEGCGDASCERGLEMQWEFVKSPPR